MTRHCAVNYTLGIVGGAAVGACAWLVLRRHAKPGIAERVSEQIEEVAVTARTTTAHWTQSLRDKLVPLLSSVGDLVEQNAELVSAVVHTSADKVRKTGQEIRHVAPALEKTLDAIASF